MYLIEFERCKEGLAIRLIDPAASGPENVLAEQVFSGNEGIALTGTSDVVVLRLPATRNPAEAGSANPWLVGISGGLAFIATLYAWTCWLWS